MSVISKSLSSMDFSKLCHNIRSLPKSRMETKSHSYGSISTRAMFLLWKELLCTDHFHRSFHRLQEFWNGRSVTPAIGARTNDLSIQVRFLRFSTASMNGSLPVPAHLLVCMDLAPPPDVFFSVLLPDVWENIYNTFPEIPVVLSVLLKLLIFSPLPTTS